MGKLSYAPIITVTSSYRYTLLAIISSYALVAGITLHQLNGSAWLVHEITSYGHFFFLGLAGAIVANATGAGGGIVFIPAFTALGISQAEAVGTSMVIQCCGMTAGTVAWLLSFKKRPYIYQRYDSLMKHVILTAGVSSIIGVLFGEHIITSSLPFSMASVFATVSILFGSIILILHIIISQSTLPKHQASTFDMMLCSSMGFIGGVITSVISIGVGEMILVLLFLQRFPVQISIFMAVAISAMTVLVAAPHYIFTRQAVTWDIVMFAAPAAMIGGGLGRLLAEKLGTARVKMFCALWILLTGFFM